MLTARYKFQIRAMKKGSVTWAILAALSYFYMVSAWGGYVFITNLVPLHVLIVLLMGRFSAKIYICKFAKCWKVISKVNARYCSTELVYLKFILISNGHKPLTCLATMFFLFLSLTLSNSEQC